VSQFDVKGKPAAWHTAFYYLAEHVRSLSGGALNHKGFYALVGTEGRYLNHSNPTVRKRTAGALSRLVHTQAYAKDMRKRYQESYSAFALAAHEVCQTIIAAQGYDDERLFAYLRDECWPDVRLGLHNEKLEWRPDMNLVKVDIEISVLFNVLANGADRQIDVRKATGSAVGKAGGEDERHDASEIVFATLLHVLAFGSFNNAFARSLLDRYPTELLEESQPNEYGVWGACLAKFVDDARSALVGTWRVGADHPFTIGRYTDCDIVETDAGVSRVHCFVYHMNGRWNFEDRSSRNGSYVEREGRVVYDSKRDGVGLPFPLEHGDTIVLAGRSFYWFGALAY